MQRIPERTCTFGWLRDLSIVMMAASRAWHFRHTAWSLAARQAVQASWEKGTPVMVSRPPFRLSYQ